MGLIGVCVCVCVCVHYAFNEQGKSRINFQTVVSIYLLGRNERDISIIYIYGGGILLHTCCAWILRLDGPCCADVVVFCHKRTAKKIIAYPPPPLIKLSIQLRR